MFSKIITALFAVNVISAANGFIDSKLRVLEPILECYEAKAPEFSGEKAMAARLSLDSETNDLELSCLAMGEYDKCLADVLQNTPSPIPKVFLFYGAAAFQASYLLKKGKACPGIEYDNLKKLVLDSGIMEQEGLSNIENDHYRKCAGDIIKKCLFESVQVYEDEVEQGKPKAGLIDDSDYAYILCIEELAKTCNYPIMRHLLEQTEAYKEHVKELEKLESEEQQE